MRPLITTADAQALGAVEAISTPSGLVLILPDRPRAGYTLRLSVSRGPTRGTACVCAVAQRNGRKARIVGQTVADRRELLPVLRLLSGADDSDSCPHCHARAVSWYGCRCDREP